MRMPESRLGSMQWAMLRADGSTAYGEHGRHKGCGASPPLRFPCNPPPLFPSQTHLPGGQVLLEEEGCPEGGPHGAHEAVEPGHTLRGGDGHLGGGGGGGRAPPPPPPRGGAGRARKRKRVGKSWGGMIDCGARRDHKVTAQATHNSRCAARGTPLVQREVMSAWADHDAMGCIPGRILPGRTTSLSPAAAGPFAKLIMPCPPNPPPPPPTLLAASRCAAATAAATAASWRALRAAGLGAARMDPRAATTGAHRMAPGGGGHCVFGGREREGHKGEVRTQGGECGSGWGCKAKGWSMLQRSQLGKQEREHTAAAESYGCMTRAAAHATGQPHGGVGWRQQGVPNCAFSCC
jgi:hypothetical protein